MEFSTTKFLDYNIFHYQILDSTNNQAKILIDENPTINNQIIICDKQTNGRGRAGRDWISDENNLFFSLILSGGVASQDHQFFSFITALAVNKTIAELSSPNLNIQIKWPNDILLNGKKTAGILLEQHKKSLIIGVGINIISHPENVKSITNIAATNLHENNIEITPENLLKNFLQQFLNYHKIFEKSGFEPIKNEYLQHAYNLGETIKIRTGDNIIEGIFEGIDIAGNLLLETRAETIKINAGEVFF